MNIITIKVRALREDETPEHSEKQTGSAPGYAEAVRDMMRKADGRWGWCIVEVTVKSGGKIGKAYLGNCSYLSAQDFVETSMYFSDLVAEAMDDMA